ncbi:hypothetical protein DXV75_15040 [Alteromonas aestuariivivens]|uniref:Uncharacterized protein n=1 Tax=Alteromonas aestuariivivens TaxID=1938339 RepID=A0A3D8M3K8_9ALTE|nr:hypothetical protein DXV75_15040 [Alteromonas aestuariivivens]
MVETLNGEQTVISTNGNHKLPDRYGSETAPSLRIITQPSDALCELVGEQTIDTEKVIQIDCYGAPEPVMVNISYDVKRVLLSWNDNSKHTDYTVYIDKNGGNEFSVLADGIFLKSYDFIVNSYQYANASIKVESCNPLGCVDSDVSHLSNTLKETIGFIESPSEDEMSLYGAKIALARSSSTLLVSAGKEMSDLNVAREKKFGTVYIYDASNGALENTARLTIDEYSSEQEFSFGDGLGISKDGTVLVVAGTLPIQNDPSTFLSGLYIYIKQSDDTWLLHQTVVPNTNDVWRLGNVIDLSFSGNTIVVSHSGVESGIRSIVVLELDGDGYYALTIVDEPINGEHSTKYGASISLSDQGDKFVVGDPRADQKSVVIGDDDFPTFEYTEGAAFVFEKVDGRWKNTHKLKSESPRFDDAFGTSVSISGDGRFIAAGSTGGEGTTGKVEIFSKQNEQWNLEQLIPSPSLSPYHEDLFGYSLAFDVNGNNLFIGSPWESSDLIGINEVSAVGGAASHSGAVYHYQLDSSAKWYGNVLIKSKYNSRYEEFGREIFTADTGTLIVTGKNYPGPIEEFSPAPGGFYIY